MSSIDHLIGQMKSLRLSALSSHFSECLQAAEQQQCSYLAFARMLVEKELEGRHARRIERNLKAAGFPVTKRLEDFEYHYQPALRKREINGLLDFTFLENRENLVLIGPPGVGKTHLAIGLGIKAVEAGYKVLFKTALELTEMLELAEMRGLLKQEINRLCKYDLLIIDELGYMPLNKQNNYNLFQLVHAVYEYRSLIITTNKDFTQWNEFFSDEQLSVPIVDRIIHHSKLFMLGGESYRLKNKLNG